MSVGYRVLTGSVLLLLMMIVSLLLVSILLLLHQLLLLLLDQRYGRRLWGRLLLRIELRRRRHGRVHGVFAAAAAAAHHQTASTGAVIVRRGRTATARLARRRCCADTGRVSDPCDPIKQTTLFYRLFTVCVFRSRTSKIIYIAIRYEITTTRKTYDLLSSVHDVFVYVRNNLEKTK